MAPPFAGRQPFYCIFFLLFSNPSYLYDINTQVGAPQRAEKKPHPCPSYRICGVGVRGSYTPNEVKIYAKRYENQ